MTKLSDWKFDVVRDDDDGTGPYTHGRYMDLSDAVSVVKGIKATYPHSTAWIEERTESGGRPFIVLR